MKNTKKSWLYSVIALLLCISLLIGTTFAWFTDYVSTDNNVITSGNIDIEMYWADDPAGPWHNVEDAQYNTIFNYDNWEPGYTDVKYIKLKNNGSLALNYELAITPDGAVGKLAEVINVHYATDGVKIDDRTDLQDIPCLGLLKNVLNGKAAVGGTLMAGDQLNPFNPSSETIVTLAMNMITTAGNEYKNESAGTFSITAIATQAPYEEDSFGAYYDSAAEMPIILTNTTTSAVVENVNNTVAEELTFAGNGVSATVPAGVSLEDGAERLTLTVTPLEKTTSGITVVNQEVMIPVDVHMAGVAEDNNVPVIVNLGAIMPKYLNLGNYRIYHIENGSKEPMTLVDSEDELTAHNTFTYDPLTGEVSVAMQSFSEVTLIADQEMNWKGNIAESFSGGTGTEADPYLIANADQLAYLNEVISNNSEAYGAKHYKLLTDINLGADSEDSHIFYPIGYRKVGGSIATIALDSDAPEAIYIIEEDTITPANNVADENGVWYTYGGAFRGVFDGNGHKIGNFYQNTWVMKGDYDGHYWDAAMGLFGYVYGGTIKNLTVDSFESDGEFTPTGVIAAYAANGAKFENIAITNCNPRVYNTGNGGIVGVGGSSSETAEKQMSFTNITVDNTNKISALWGSWDVACGGIMGMFRGYSKVDFINCHVAAQIDVFNDVCGNYQYYWYRYSGMIIGSLRGRNITDKDGYTVPDMQGITCKDCTVKFDEWNDYYYCELVANSLASYTHDHQMSRLEIVAEVDVGNMKYTPVGGSQKDIPTSGRYNFVVLEEGNYSGERATCYHFVNGNKWEHEDAGTEMVNGKEVFKEDNQHIYLPFNQLFQGDGWGVKHIPIYDNNSFPGITILERDAKSEIKFAVQGNNNSFETDTTIKIGDLFKEVAEKKFEIKSDRVNVFISPVGTDSTADAVYVADKENWENGTLTFSGIGAAQITITDYYFCEPTKVVISVIEPQYSDKFDTKFTGEFTYRVGNVGTVTLGTIFKAKEGATGRPIDSSSVSVAITNNKGNASGTFTANTSDWTKGTIKFNGTGVVTVTIVDAVYCNAYSIDLEVVDAVNSTAAVSATSNNVVLLNDCGFSSIDVSGGYTLYGNGFKMTAGSDSPVLNFGYSFVTLSDGTLDNVQIICPNYDYAALYKSNLESSENRSQTTDRTRYYNAKSGVMASGNSRILNSLISGARAAVNVTNGNLVIDNSHIKGGAVASVLVGTANSLTLRDVTLIQKPTASTIDASKKLMGFSVLYLCDSDGKATKTTLEGSFVQQAWVNAEDKQYVPSAGQGIVDAVMKETSYIHSIEGKDNLNLGFAYMPEDTTKTVDAPDNIIDNRTDKATIPYEMKDVKIQLSLLNTTVYVYSYKNTNGTAASFVNDINYKPNKYSDIITVTYADAADGLTIGKTFGTDGWIYELNVDLDKLNGYAIDFSKLSMTVNGENITDFKVNGSAKPASPVAVAAGGTSYDLTATINGKDYKTTFKVIGTETSKDSPSLVGTPSYGAGFGVANKYNGDWSAAAPVLDGITIRYWSVAEGAYKEFPLSSITFANTGKQNGSNSYWEYTHTNNDFTLKLTNTAAIHSGSNTFGIPVAGKDGKLYFTIASTGGFVGNGTSSRSIAIKYEFTDNNGGETLTFNHTWNIAQDETNQYNYNSFVNDGTLTKLEDSGSSSCITPDTLITLADGRKVRVDSLTGNEQLLVWNLKTGKYDSAPIVFVDSDAQDEYEIIHLYFSNGSDVKVISEHGFFDVELGKYVYIDAENYAQYLGHSFIVEGDIAAGEWSTVTLDNVVIEKDTTTAWSPVTFEHLCYYTNGVLSMPGGVEGLFNIFEVDTDTMRYDEEQMQKDIETYGLFTFDDFGGLIPEIAFEAFNGDYLKVAIGKGMLTWEDIAYMAERYVPLI